MGTNKTPYSLTINDSTGSRTIAPGGKDRPAPAKKVTPKAEPAKPKTNIYGVGTEADRQKTNREGKKLVGKVTKKFKEALGMGGDS